MIAKKDLTGIGTCGIMFLPLKGLFFCGKDSFQNDTVSGSLLLAPPQNVRRATGSAWFLEGGDFLLIREQKKYFP